MKSIQEITSNALNFALSVPWLQEQLQQRNLDSRFIFKEVVSRFVELSGNEVLVSLFFNYAPKNTPVENFKEDVSIKVKFNPISGYSLVSLDHTHFEP